MSEQSTKRPPIADRITKDAEGNLILDGETKITVEQAEKNGWNPSMLPDDQPDEDARQTAEEQGPGQAAVAKAAKSVDEAKEMDAGEKQDAVAWFLSSDPEESVATRQLELNVSTDPSKPLYIVWTVQALPRERIQEIRDKARKQAQGRRRRQDIEDGLGKAGVIANLKIAAEGTLYPNLRDPQIRGDYLDPADALSRKFASKPGLIDQISAHVIEVSGYDEDDVREVDAVKT